MTKIDFKSRADALIEPFRQRSRRRLELPSLLPDAFRNRRENILDVEVRAKSRRFLAGTFEHFRRAWLERPKIEKETFAEAVARKRLTPAHLIIIEANLIQQSRIAYGTGVLLLTAAFLALALGLLPMPLPVVLAAAAMTLASWVTGWTWAFRVYQVRTRTLCPLSEFMGRADTWIV